MATPSDYLVVGRVVGLFGVRGWVKIQSYTQPREQLLDYRPWYLQTSQGWQVLAQREAQVHGKGLIARLANCGDPDDARPWIGCDIAIQRSQLPPLGSDEYYWADLVGLRVDTLEGVVLGTVDHLLETGANDVLVVQGDRERLIPYLPDQVIRQVDLLAGRLLVDWNPED